MVKTFSVKLHLPFEYRLPIEKIRYGEICLTRGFKLFDCCYTHAGVHRCVIHYFKSRDPHAMISTFLHMHSRTNNFRYLEIISRMRV
jgi:hypothetical protein